MKDQFLPYSYSVILKSMGFDEECLGHYYDGNFEFFVPSNFLGISKCTNSRFGLANPYYFTAPLWQQAFEWFADRYKMSSHIIQRDDNVYWRIIILGDLTGNARGYSKFSPDRISAKMECLDKLIELSSK